MTPDIDDLARTMVRAPDVARDYVIDRLKMAAKVIEAANSSGAPSSGGGFWPKMLVDGWDVHPDTDRKERFCPTPRQITEAEEALEWRKYVTDPNCLRALNLWITAKARRRPWQKLAEQRGMVRETVKRRQSRAISLIVYGLAKDGFRPR